MAIGLLLATLVGASLGVLGAGGSIVTVPLLVYVVGLDAQHAAATSLLVVGVVATAGTAMHWPAVRVRAGVLFGAAGLLGVAPGVWLNHRVPPAILLGAFGALLLVAAARLPRAAPATAAHEAHPLAALAGGAGVGFATGFFGVGGGFLIVPALMALLGLDLAGAAATSLLVIALNCAAGLAGHGTTGAVEWRLGLAFGGVALLAALLATPLARRLPPARLRHAFAATLAVVGTGMLLRSLATP